MKDNGLEETCNTYESVRESERDDKCIEHLVRKLERNRPLRRSKTKLLNSIKMDH
jgi:hypothetical protein